MALPLIPIALGLQAAGLGVSLFGPGGMFGSKAKGPDIGGELAKISELIARQRAAAQAQINFQSGEGRKQAATNLAARGVLRAPVSQLSFNALEQERIRSLANLEGQLAGQEAGLRTRLMESLLGATGQAQLLEAQRTGALGGALGSIGGSLLSAGLMRGGATGAANPGFVDRTGLGPTTGRAPIDFRTQNLISPFAGQQAAPFNFRTF